MSVREDLSAFVVRQINSFFDGWTVIQAKQDIPVKPSNYIVVDLLSERLIGDQHILNKTDETLTVSGMREATLNIQAFGRGAIEALGELWQFFEHPYTVDAFQEKNFAVISVGDVQDLTALLDGRGYQERASVDFTASYTRTITRPVYWFDTVECDGVLYYVAKDEKVANNMGFVVKNILIKQEKD